MLRLLTVLFALLQLSSALQLGGVRANVQLRRSASPLMGVSFKVGDTVMARVGKNWDTLQHLLLEVSRPEPYSPS